MDVKLMHALDFNVDDLRANRSGRITARQVARLRQTQRATVLRFAVGSVVFIVLAGAVLVVVEREPGTSVLAAVLRWGLFFIFGLVAGFNGAVAYLTWLTLQNAHYTVQLAVGQVRLQVTDDHSGQPTHYMMIGGRRFAIDQHLYESLFDGTYYAVYFVDNGGILSVEPD